MSKALKLKLYFIFFWIFLVISFSTLAIFVLSEATGYRFNWQTHHLELTGLISLDGVPKQAKIVINSKIQNSGFPLKINKVFPGQYEILVSEVNYSKWSKTVYVTGGQAIEERDIELFLTNIQPKITDRKISREALSNDFASQGSQLTVKDNEIWYLDKLVSRFGSTVYSAIFNSDKDHIYFQAGPDLRVMDIDGSNTVKLFTFPKDEKYTYALYNNDKILYLDADNIDELKIH